MYKNIKKGQIDLYCAFIASRFFNTIDDFINFEMINSYFYANMTKFHYNPISLDEKLLPFFPTVETLHLYNKNDKYLKGQRIQWYVNWWEEKGWYESQKSNNNLKEKYSIEYKHIVYNRDDAVIDLKNTSYVKIPNGVKEIDSCCFYFSDIISISIPSSVETIGDRCFGICRYLTNVTGIENVKNIGRLVFYGSSQISDEIIEIVREKHRKCIHSLLTPKQLMKLEYWVQRKVENVVFDWNNETSQKENVRILPHWYGPNSHYGYHYFIIQTEENIVFGGYSEYYFPQCCSFSGPIMGLQTDKNAFIFSLRHEQPEKYPVINSERAIEINTEYQFSDNHSDFLQFGNDFYISFTNSPIPTRCSQSPSSTYDYGKRENALLGYTGQFKMKRMMVIKMSDKIYELPNVIVDDIKPKQSLTIKKKKHSCIIV